MRLSRRQEHNHHRQHLLGFGYLKSLGPGLITGASDDDPSGIGTYSQVGAAFRFDLLWTAWLTFPLAAAVQETTGRLALHTGKGLAALIRKRFPRSILYVAVALMVVANTFNVGADLGAMAESLRLLIPLPFIALLVVVTGGTLALEVFLSYRVYAKYLRWLCLSLVAYIVVLFFLKIDWTEVLTRTLVPVWRTDKAYQAALIAILGTTISPYLFFWQPAEEVEEIEEHRDHAPMNAAHVKSMRQDTFTGMFSAVAVMFAIMVAAGATLGQHGITTVQTASQAARALEPIAGHLAALLFTVGIVGTGLLAVPVLAGSVGYALSESFNWREGLSNRFRQAPGFYLAIIAAMLVGFGMQLIGINPIRALFLAAILNGIAAPPLILLLLILGNSKSVIGKARSGWLSNGLVAFAFLLMAALPLLYILR